MDLRATGATGEAFHLLEGMQPGMCGVAYSLTRAKLADRIFKIEGWQR